MNLSKTLTSITALGLVGIAIADDKPRVEIEVITDEGPGDATYVQFDSADLGFDLHDMQEGENQAIVDENGRTILVTRETDGFTFTVDGKSISVPMIDGDHETMMMVHSEHDIENVDIEVVHEVVEGEGAHDGPHQVRVVKKIEIVEE